MPQYAQPWKHRLLQSTIDAIRNYPEFPQGSRNWDERAYHPDGTAWYAPERAVAEGIGAAVYAGDCNGSTPGQRASGRRLRIAWSESHQLRLELARPKARTKVDWKQRSWRSLPRCARVSGLGMQLEEVTVSADTVHSAASASPVHTPRVATSPTPSTK